MQYSYNSITVYTSLSLVWLSVIVCLSAAGIDLVRDGV